MVRTVPIDRITLVCGFAASLLLAAALLDHQGRARRERAEAELERLGRQLALVTEAHAVALERMAERADREAGAEEARWRADARSHLGGSGAFAAFARIGPAGETRWEPAGDATPHEALTALARDLGPGGRARLGDGLPGREAVAAAAALAGGGALVALLDVGRLAELAWGSAEGPGVVLSGSSGDPLYPSPSRPAAGSAAPPGAMRALTLRGLDWKLHLAPEAPGAIAAAPALGLAAGAGLTLLLSLTLGLRRTALERAEALEGVSRELEASAAQLLSTNAELLRSNEELGRFATLASHDLQEPLRQIVSFSERLEERHAGSLDEHGRTCLGFVREAAARARVLIEDLLRYARVDGQAFHRETVDCNEAFLEASERLRGLIEETGAEISADPLPRVRGNAVLFAQLFQNLLGNALKYCGDCAPRVHVGVRDAGSMWEFSVRDRGIGIHPDYHRKVFEIFERLPDAGAEIEGTGVGLALCKKVVERLGGDIRVESTPGAGSDFRFTIPKLDDFKPDRATAE